MSYHSLAAMIEKALSPHVAALHLGVKLRIGQRSVERVHVNKLRPFPERSKEQLDVISCGLEAEF